ncbi:MAG: uracil phosphoribosyltransferase [Chlamydiales bacterium 38-26]|nr:uracil phosphoribosyltransferase [Chlamydiales bacterium]OJV11390.1 MAG: uracil phosphoribosyltransferase [Chlamydiales bacterium 38-26]
MKKILISILRNQNTSIDAYRQAAEQLSNLLAIESSQFLPKQHFVIQTPLAQTDGVQFENHTVLIPVLRSGLVLLPPFLHYYPKARVGFIGARRDEKTAIAELYYLKLPPLSKDTNILLLDPMIATGGTASLAIKTLIESGAEEKQITLISFISSPDGMKRLQEEYPTVGLLIAQIDEGLDPAKRIIPGLGDFGDRYFGNES